MEFKKIALILLGCLILFPGCETVKGAKQGFKKDWQAFVEWDKKWEESLW